MAYIERNEAGKIVAVFESPPTKSMEQIALDSPELIEYLIEQSTSEPVESAFAASDIGLVRVIEDLINTLIDKKIILFTELPLAAREKLVNREKIRNHLSNLDDLINDDGKLL